MNVTHFIVTDFGMTVLTPKALEYVGGSEGFALIRNKRRQGRKAKYLRARMKRLETAVMVLAEIEFVNGGDLVSF